MQLRGGVMRRGEPFKVMHLAEALEENKKRIQEKETTQ
jgi:hypothetical protein